MLLPITDNSSILDYSHWWSDYTITYYYWLQTISRKKVTMLEVSLCTCTYWAASHLTMCSISIVIVVKRSISNHYRNVRMIMLFNKLCIIHRSGSGDHQKGCKMSHNTIDRVLPKWPDHRKKFTHLVFTIVVTVGVKEYCKTIKIILATKYITWEEEKQRWQIRQLLKVNDFGSLSLLIMCFNLYKLILNYKIQ